MQYKLLNYYKMIANIANDLVSLFVPLIIFQLTGSLIHVMLYLIFKSLFRCLSDVVFKKAIQLKPELFLMFRFVTMGAYLLSLSIVPYNFLIGSFIVAFFSGVDISFKSLGNETLFNYASSRNADAKKIGLTRVFEQLGKLAGVLLGGMLLDVNKTIVYILAASLYLIAIVPLFIFYLKNKGNKTFNAEFVSNASIEMSKGEKNDNLKYLAFFILLSYGSVYFSYAISDSITTMYNVINLVSTGASYSMASWFILALDLFYCLGSLIVNKIDQKFDLMIFARIACVILAVIFVIISFVDNVYLMLICFALFGLFYSFITVFMLQRLMAKSRIVGQSNNAFFIRETVSCVAYVVFYTIALIFVLLNVSLKFYFILASVMLLLTFFIIPKIEERTRKMLVDFVEDNEIGVVKQKNKREN